MFRFLFLCCICFSPIGVCSQQNYVKGKVVDSETGEPLAFVSIVANDANNGCTTDIDGKFSLSSHEPISILKLSYVGYYSKSYYIKNTDQFLTIPLKNKKTEIKEVVVVPGENPAHRIIEKVIENRKINNPEKQHSFSYNSYNKFLVTAVKPSKNDTNIFISDTVEFQKLLPDTIQHEKKGAIVVISQKKSFDLDSGQIISIIQDTQIVHQVLRPLIDDSSNLMKIKMGLVFIRDNPSLVKKYILKADSSLNVNQLSNGFNSFFEKYFSDTIETNQILITVDSLLHNPKVLSVLVPAIDSVLNDTVMMGKILPHLQMDKLLMSKLSEELKNDVSKDFDIEKQHVFLMESITEREFLFPDNSFEDVLATRVSGFKDPLFVLLASQIQSFTFYSDVINIGRRNYVNPISPGSIHKYFFLIEDTIFNGIDTVFIISFQPKRNKNFEGLEGVLYINTNTYAVQNVIAKSARSGFLNTKIEQKYAFVDQKQWFPVQLNTEVTISSEYFDNSDDPNQHIPVGVGRTYIKNIKINPDLRRRDFNEIVVDVDESAASRKEEYWNKYRIAPLDAKEIRTYRYMDSIGKEANIERYTRSFFILKSGLIPAGIFSFDIKKLVNYNQYEGFRPGLAVQTNHRFSEWIRPGAYFAYGTKDKEWKFGGNINLFIDKRQELETNLYYCKDVSENGVEEIFLNNSLFSDAYWRSFLYSNLANIRQTGFILQFRALNYFKWKWMLNKTDYTTSLNPLSSDPEFTLPVKTYKITELSLGFRYAYKEKLIRTPQQEFIQTFSQKPVRSKYPVIWFQYSKGLDILGGNYSYNRFDVKIEKSFYLKYLGTSSFKLEGGIIDKNVPLVRLYNSRAAYRIFTIDAPNSFVTMRMDEFFSDRYISLFFDHNFGKLLIRTEKFTPEFHLITNMTFGEMHYMPENLPNYKTPEKGFFESGVLIKKLVRLKVLKVGIGAYYRYGSYAFDDFIDNCSFRLTLNSPI